MVLGLCIWELFTGKMPPGKEKAQDDGALRTILVEGKTVSTLMEVEDIQKLGKSLVTIFVEGVSMSRGFFATTSGSGRRGGYGCGCGFGL